MNKINVAIIGANFGSKVHVPAFNLIEDANVMAICSKNINNAADVAKHNNNIKIVTDNWLDIMENDSVHAVSIAVPPLESYEIFKSAIKHNKHIFCEKPLASNLSNAIDIKNLLNDNIIHAIDFEICESRIVKKLKQMISSKYLGYVNSFELNWKLITNFSNNSSWKLDANKGGGALNNFGSHIFHLLEYVFSDRIQSVSGKLLPSLEFNTYMEAITDFKSFNGSINIDANTKSPSDFILKVHCEHGTFLLKNNTAVLKNFSLLIQYDTNEPIIVDYENDLSNKDGRIELVSSVARKFINGIKLNSQATPNIYDGARAQFLTDILLNKG